MLGVIHVSNLVGKFAFREESRKQLYRASNVRCRPEGWVELELEPIHLSLSLLTADQKKLGVGIVAKIENRYTPASVQNIWPVYLCRRDSCWDESV